MIFFFDRSLGTRIPRALRDLIVLPGHEIKIHDEEFPIKTPDDVWLEAAGRANWIVFSQDYHLHLLPNQLFAIQQWKVGGFYLWGAEAPRWEKLRVFARAYDRILSRAVSTPKPFLYRVRKDSRIDQVALHTGLQIPLTM